MKQTITENMFIEAFRNSSRSEQFSIEALRAIFEYIENYEQDSGEEIELDIVAVCCDWSEDTPEEIAEAYGIEYDKDECTGEELSNQVFEYLNDNSAHAELLDNGNIVYVQF